MNYDALFARLADEGYTTQRQAPPGAAPAPGAPWYTRVMLGFAGWMAGLFLVGFFAGTFVLLMKTPHAMLALGLGLCVAAVLIDRAARDGDVVPQLALAVGMAGRTFFTMAAAELAGSNNTQVAAWAVVTLEAVIFVALRSPLHRALGVMIAAAALYYALHKLRLAGVAAGLLAVPASLLWAHEARWRTSRRLHDAGVALAWGLAIALLMWPLPGFLLEEKAFASRGMEAAGYAAGLLLFSLSVARGTGGQGVFSLSLGTGPGRGLAIAAVLLLAIAAPRAPGVLAGTLVLLAGLASGRHVLAALGVAGIVGYLAIFYYQLDQTLLGKSASLAAAGVVLLAARFVVRRFLRGGRP